MNDGVCTMDRVAIVRPTTFFLLVICVHLTGCDSVRRGTQIVRMKVTDSASGLPVQGAVVVCAPVKRAGPSNIYALPVKDYIDRFRSTSQTSDTQGRVSIVQDLFVLKGGVYVWVGIDRLTLKDVVTGQMYYVRIELGKLDETFTIKMRQGLRTEGEKFTLQITLIDPPKSLD